MKRKWLAILASVLLLCAMLPLSAVGVSAATYYGDLTYTVNNGEVTITDCYESASGALTIPSTIEGYPVTTIGDRAFYDCTSLTSVTIPDSVTTIGSYAFAWCYSLTAVTIPDSVTTIGDTAFYKCTSLTTVTIPDSVTTIGSHAFAYCHSLTTVTIGDSVTTIGDWAFYGCTSLTEVTIGDSVTTIGDSAFEYCYSLTTVTIGDSVTTIGDWAFEYCYSLTSVTIGDSVTTIGSYAFSWCTSLTSVTIPDSVTTIGSRAFYGCDSLTTITVSADHTNYSSVDGVLFNKDKTTLIQYPGGKIGAYAIPDSVTTIGDLAFGDCDSLTEVTIGDSVTTIRSYAFYGCESLTSVTIGDSVTTIGSYAFDGCTSLTDVYYTGTEEQAKTIEIGVYNYSLLDATWHYNSINPKDQYSANVQHSVMDTEKGNGLAFRFELVADNVRVTNGTVADYTNATVNYLGNDCKLVGMGAVITNDDEKGNILQMLRENVNGENMVDIPVVYLYDVGVSSCTFATRIINIPDTQLERTIYARPYYIVEVDGEQITVYGDVDSASCAEYM